MAAVLTVVAVWWILGVTLPDLFTDNKAEAGQFGDRFGGVNALFSGLALAGVVTAIFIQMREIRLNEKAQSHQIEIAQIVSRIQAFAFFADLQVRLMPSVDHDTREEYRYNAEICIKRAIALLEELKEPFPEGSLKAVDIRIPTHAYQGAVRLISLAERFHDGIKHNNVGSPNNEGANSALLQIKPALEEWLQGYDRLMPVQCVGHIRTALSLISARAHDSMVQPQRTDAHFEGRWKLWGDYWTAVHTIARNIDDAVKMAHGIPKYAGDRLEQA